MKHQARQDCFPASDTSSHDQHALAGVPLRANEPLHWLHIFLSCLNPVASPGIAADLRGFSAASATRRATAERRTSRTCQPYKPGFAHTCALRFHASQIFRRENQNEEQQGLIAPIVLLCRIKIRVAS